MLQCFIGPLLPIPTAQDFALTSSGLREGRHFSVGTLWGSEEESGEEPPGQECGD